MRRSDFDLGVVAGCLELLLAFCQGGIDLTPALERFLVDRANDLMQFRVRWIDKNQAHRCEQLGKEFAERAAKRLTGSITPAKQIERLGASQKVFQGREQRENLVSENDATDRRARCVGRIDGECFEVV